MTSLGAVTFRFATLLSVASLHSRSRVSQLISPGRLSRRRLLLCDARVKYLCGGMVKNNVVTFSEVLITFPQRWARDADRLNRPSAARSQASIEFAIDGSNRRFAVVDRMLRSRFRRDLLDLVPVWAHQDFPVDPAAPEWEKETGRLERVTNTRRRRDYDA